MSGRHKYEKDRSYQAYQAEFEEFNSRFNGKTEIKKLSFEELEIDRQKMDKLIGYSSPPKKKLKSAKEVYQHDWREMHTSQDVLDYEQRMKKYKKKELQTPYEKDFYYLKKPETGYWPAKTPLYNEIHKKNKIVPEETERGAAPPRAPPPPRLLEWSAPLGCASTPTSRRSAEICASSRPGRPRAPSRP